MNNDMETPHLTLDGSNLSVESVVRAARDPKVRVQCSPEALDRVVACREQIERVAEQYASKWDAVKDTHNAKGELPLVYGVTTGFGEFKEIPIPPDQLEALQKRILLSHSTGVGDNPDELDLGNYFTADVVRATLILRLNTFLRGNSGVRLVTVKYVQAMINGGIVPLVPLRGSVGSSGDLCPLAHLFATLLGEGSYHVVKSSADLESVPPKVKAAAKQLKGDLAEELAGLDVDSSQWPYQPSHKEGLALTNSAAFCSATLALAVHDAQMAAATADIATALGFEAICGRVRCLDEKVHEARGMLGQQNSAHNLRELLKGSKQVERAEGVQDAYSLRCAPQVHGATRDAIAYAHMVVEREINASTDNPLFFPGERPWDLDFADNHDESGRDENAYSAGNFHGQPIGLAADFLAIAVAELASISERRTQMLLDRHHNRNLPANLIPNRGTNSGFMVAQYCSAGLVSENKVLTHPASVDSIPTSANSEDHVAMASIAARKLRTVVSNTQAVLAIELMCVAQAIDWRVGTDRPLKKPVQSNENQTPAQVMKEASDEAKAFKRAATPKASKATATKLGRGTAAAYLALRDIVRPIEEDCVLDESIRKIWQLIRSGQLIEATQIATGEALKPVMPLRYCEEAQ